MYLLSSIYATLFSAFCKDFKSRKSDIRIHLFVNRKFEELSEVYTVVDLFLIRHFVFVKKLLKYSIGHDDLQ